LNFNVAIVKKNLICLIL